MENGRSFSMAEVIWSSGSTPQKAGAMALFEANGSVWGTLGGGCLEAESRQRALEALERVELSDRVMHKPNELSGGQRQRVAVARALVNNPSILLADEPTGNLDSCSGEEVIEILEQLNRDGISLMVVTHNREIGRRARRHLTLHDGKIVRDQDTAS